MLDATITPDSTLYPLLNPPPGNALASVAFNESETMAAGTAPAVGSTVNLVTGKIGIFYTDERAMTLGVSQVTTITAGGSSTTSYPVSPFPVLPNGTVAASVTNPQVGAPYTPPTNLSALPIQPGTDPFGRPVFPSLYVTDLSADNGNPLAGDWEFGGTPQSPNAVYGTWKSVTETIDETTSPAKVTFNVPNDPQQNKWDLGPGADPAPTTFQNQGYGAEAQWNLASVVDQNGHHLVAGDSYRFYFMVHDGDQNKTGGDVGQAAFDLKSAPAPTISTTTGGTVVLGSGAKLTDSANLSNGSNPTGSITFNLYSPTDTTYSNPVYTTSVPVSGNGSYSVNSALSTNPGGFLPTVAGTYEWVASYSGDKNNSPTTSGNGNEPDTVSSAPPALTTQTSGTVALHSGTKLNDTATLAGGSNPAGTITFYLFAPGVAPNASNSNNVYSDTVTVSGNGNYSTSAGTNPGGYLPISGGTYQWVAVYNSNSSPVTGLGAAGNFAVLGLSGSNISITNPSTTINGNVGLGPNGTQNFADGTINGNYEVDPTADNSKANNVVVTGTTTTTSLSAAQTAAVTESQQIAGLAPTQVFGSIANSQTINGNGGVNVIDVSQINLSGSSALTFDGGPNDVFYVNDPGAFQMSGTSTIQLNGVTPGQVIFNTTGAGSVQFSGGSVAQGVFLAVDRSIARSNGVLNGSLIGGENGSIAITSAAQINFPPSITISTPFTSEPQNVVDASISIAPLTPVNPVGSPETFTITVTALPAGTGAPSFGLPTVTFPTGTPGTVDPVTLVGVNGNVATYTETINSTVAGSFDVKASDTVTMGGVAVTRTTGDGLSGDSSDAVKTYVTAGISITPPTPVNEVNHQETFTITETASPLAGQVPTFGVPVISFPLGAPVTVGGVLGPVVNGNSATFTVSINNPTAGTFDVKATATITIGGVNVVRSTGDGLPGDSLDAVKNYVDAKIAITPLNPVNNVNHPETFTITVTASPAGTGAPSFALPVVSFPGGAPGTVGPVTQVSVNGNVATYTETINSAVPGVFNVQASDTVTMGTVAVTRTTGDNLSGDSPSATKTYVGLNIATTPGGTVVLGSGTPLSDTATLAGGNNPTGSITFYLFAPGVVPNAGNSNNVYSDAVPLTGLSASTGTGTITGSAVPTQAGIYQWVAVYSGDASNSSVTSSYLSEPETVNASGPTINTQAGGFIVLGSGRPLSDTATLTGGNNPTGTVTFYLFAPGVAPNATNSNNVYSDMAPLVGNSASTGTGTSTGSAIPTVLGTYQWIAVYNGDTNNKPVASSYNSEPEVSTSPPAISTFEGGTLHLGSGGKLYDSAQLQGGMNPTGTITFYLFAPGVNPNATDSNNIYSDVVPIDPAHPYALYDVTMGNNPNPPALVPMQTGTYQWVAVYSGDANNPPQASEFGDEPQQVVPPVQVIPTIATTPGGSVVLGSGKPLTDSATLAGGNNPTGTVTFYLFAPGVVPNATNSNNVYSDVVTLTGLTASTGTGTTTGTAVPTMIGTYEWVAVYNGDANNQSVTSAFNSESEVVASPPAISTFEGATLHLGSGGKLYDSAQLQGGMNPTGTITFYLFAPGVNPNATDSNNIYSDVVPIDPAHPYALYDVTMGNNPNSPALVPTQTGAYQWVAVYSGDANNPPQASQYGDEPQQVVPPTQVTPAIATTPGGTVVLGSGASLSDSATLSGGNNPTGTVTFYLFAPGVDPNATDSNAVYSEVAPLSGTTASTGTGKSTGSAVPTAVGTYEWVAVYSGDTNNQSVTSAFGSEGEVVTSPGQAQVVVFKIADQPQIDAGQTAGFTIKILNEGANTATGLTLNDPLPAGVANDINWQIDSSGTGFGAGTNPSDFSITGSAGHLVLNLASSISTLAAGASISVHITGQTSLNDVDPNLPPCTTTLVNTATVNAANEPANEQNAQATATITLHNVDVDVSKTADQAQVVAGQMAGFTIQVYNQGCVDAEGLTLNDQLSAGPGNDIFWRLDPTQGSPEYFQIVGQIGSQVLEFSSHLIDLQPGMLISVHIVGQTSNYDVGAINNTVTVNASNEPSFEDNAQASAAINIVQNTQNNGTALYVEAAFEQTLYRAPDQASLQAYVNALNSGAMSQTTFAMTLTHGSEYYSDIVAQAYEHFLGRTPDAQGSAYWTQQLENGLTDEQLEAQFIGSAEYYQVSGGTDKAWVDHMYFDLLGRAPDNQGESYWVQALANGASRSAVALGFAASAEREGQHVKDDYQIFLGRLPAQSEIDSWVSAFENGLTNEDVIAGFIAAPEYYNRHS